MLPLLLGFAVAVALTVSLPRRWLAGVMLLWLLAPALLFAVTAIHDLLTRPDPSVTFGHAVTGLLFVALVGSVPWAVLSGLGVGLGLLLRRLLRRDGAAPPAGEVPP